MSLFDFFFGNQGSNPSKGAVSLDTARTITDEWEAVALLLKQKGPSQLRQALITADKLLDLALKDIATGESMGERLKNSSAFFDRSIYSKIWEAHKLRNMIVHETGFEPSHFMITEAVSNLKEGLFKLGVRI